MQAAEPPPPRVPVAGSARRRFRWRLLLAALVAVLLLARFGGSLAGGAPSELREVRTPVQSLRYPGSFGRARVQRIGEAYERIQVAGFGDAPVRGPKAALEAVLKLTRAGGLLFEARAVASPGERDYLLRHKPYACAPPENTRLQERIGWVQVRRAVRGVLFRWLPSSVFVCGTVVQEGVLRHVSGFATDATWQRDGESLRRTLREWQVDAQRLPRQPAGCRMDVSHDPPLYVQFRDEAAARAGRVSQDTVRWIDLPYERDESVGRFTPARLQEVSVACAEEQQRFAEWVEKGTARDDPQAQAAHHAFRARCEPLFPTLRHLGSDDTFAPDSLPRPLDGWTLQLADTYVPAACLPLVSAEGRSGPEK